jgi:ribosomal protein L9
MPMNLILLERVPKLGQMGDVVKVKPGFARNYLLPQKKALRATKDNIAYFESQRKVLEAQNLERRQEAEKVGGKVDAHTNVRGPLSRKHKSATHGSISPVFWPDAALSIPHSAGARNALISRDESV